MKNNRIITTTIFLLFVVSTIFARTTITMEKDGGVYKVPCVVNGLRMKFIFDTGAANVCISESMATYMLENDYLDKSDILGTGQSSVADGRIVDHVKIQLSYLEIGGLRLNNVEAVVISGQSSPLLLGQSAISKMGKVSINGNVLIIEESRECSQQEIDYMLKKADSYYNNAVYDKALPLYQRVNDCNGLSDYGKFIMGRCHSELGNYNQALLIYEELASKVEERQSSLNYDTWSALYIEIATCYRMQNNYQACISYDKIALSCIPASAWELESGTYYEIALCYMTLHNYDRADEYAIKGIACILRNKYPKVYEVWERQNFKNLGDVMDRFRWGKDTILGDMIFILCDDYYHALGEPHCQMTRIAAELGSSVAQEARKIWRSYGLYL